MFGWFKKIFSRNKSATEILLEEAAEDDVLELTEEDIIEDTDDLLEEVEELRDIASEHTEVLETVRDIPKEPSEQRDDVNSRRIDHIIIHCSATRANNDIGVDELRMMHTTPKPHGRGWRDVGYNYVIRRDGTIELGRDLNNNGLVDDEVGAHAFGWNANSLGICLIGGADIRGRGESNFTPAQMTALAAFLVAKRQQYPGVNIIGHRDTGSNKDCPSFNVAHWLRTGKMIEPINLA